MASKQSKLNQAAAAELRAARAAVRITQEAIAEATGLSRSTVRRIFAGDVEISASNLVSISGTLAENPGRILDRAIERAGGLSEAMSDARASLGGSDTSGDELSTKRRQKAAAEMSVEELEGQRSAATKDPELDTDEPDVP